MFELPSAIFLIADGSGFSSRGFYIVKGGQKVPLIVERATSVVSRDQARTGQARHQFAGKEVPPSVWIHYPTLLVTQKGAMLIVTVSSKSLMRSSHGRTA